MILLPPPPPPPGAPPVAPVGLIELPLALCPEGRLSLAALPIRTAADQSYYSVWLGRNYGSSSAASYELLAQGRQFATALTLVTDYPVTPLIDTAVGILVSLDGLDKTVAVETFFDAMANQLLLFLEAEVMSVISATVLGANLYRLQVIRGRYATVPQIHSGGTAGFLLPSGGVVPLQHPSFVPNNLTICKVVMGNDDPGTYSPISLTIAGFIYQQCPPVNLLVNGDGIAPTYAHLAGVTITWTLTEAGRDFFQPAWYQVSTVLEFLVSGSVAGTTTAAAGVSSLTLTNTALVALIGGSEVSFKVRAKTRTARDWWQIDSPATAQLLVTKI